MSQPTTPTPSVSPDRLSTCVECGDQIIFTHYGRGMLWVSSGPARQGPKCKDGWGHLPASSL